MGTKKIKMQMFIVIIPIIFILMIILIILSVIASLFGSETAVYQESFVLPFDTNNFSITSPYGERIDPINEAKDFHNGIDVVPTSSNIGAAADGIIIISDVDDENGEHIVIEHNIGGTIYHTGYYHLKEDSRVVQVGEKVVQGQQLGIMGSTGRSTGNHLHFSLQKYNVGKQEFEYTDPSTIINNKITAKKYLLYDYDDIELNDLDNE